LIQAQSSEADEHLSYLDPQSLGLLVPDSDYPIGEEEEVKQYLLYTPAHPTFQSLLPSTSPSITMADLGPIPSGSGSGVSTVMQNTINAAVAALPQGQGYNAGKNYKLPDQTNFSRCAENVESFLLECTM